MTDQRAIIYCIIPAELAGVLHEPLRSHYHADPLVDVIVEQRQRERRHRDDRRAEPAEPAEEDRRRVRARTGRRISERRAGLVATEARPLPDALSVYAEQVRFVERLEPSSLAREDADTAHLVARLQAGESSLFSALYMRYFDRVYAYLRITLQDAHEAEDATQEVFIRVLEALPRYERRQVPFRAWLFRIVRNSAVNRLRQRRRLSFESPEALQARGEGATQPQDVLDWLEDRDLVEMIEQLPLAQRQVIVLRYMLELRSSEIAVILERSPEAVRQLHQRAMRFLRARMAPADAEPARQGVGRVQRESMRRARPQAPVLRARRYMLN